MAFQGSASGRLGLNRTRLDCRSWDGARKSIKQLNRVSISGGVIFRPWGRTNMCQQGHFPSLVDWQLSPLLVIFCPEGWTVISWRRYFPSLRTDKYVPAKLFFVVVELLSKVWDIVWKLWFVPINNLIYLLVIFGCVAPDLRSTSRIIDVLDSLTIISASCS